MKHRGSLTFLGIALAALAGASPAAAAPINDNAEDAIEITSLPFTDTRSLEGATRQDGEPYGCGSDQTVWYRFTPAVTTLVLGRTSGYPYFIDVFRTPFVGDLLECGVNVRFEMDAGTTYLLRVGIADEESASGLVTFSLTTLGALSGTVTDLTDGSPAVDVCVSAWEAQTKRIIKTTHTDDDGEWTLIDLPVGPVKVRFLDCDQATYRTTWYPRRASWRSAIPVEVPSEATLAGLDIALARVALPDIGITHVEIEDAPLAVGPLGEEGPATGISRVIKVDVGNTGASTPEWSYVSVRVCPRTSGQCKYLDAIGVTLQPGDEKALTFFWNSADMVGDVLVAIRAAASADGDLGNNSEDVPYYVHVGGTGFGFALPCASPLPCGL